VVPELTALECAAVSVKKQNTPSVSQIARMEENKNKNEFSPSKESSVSRCVALCSGVMSRVALKNLPNQESGSMEYSFKLLPTAWSTPIVPHAFPMVCRVYHTC
jgi:hypothetical protein